MRAALILSILAIGAVANAQPRRLVFEKPQAVEKLTLKDLGPDVPADWSGYNYLVLEMRTSTPQRFHLIIQDKTGVRRLGFQPIGQNVWFQAAVPLKFFKGRDQSGYDLASVANRPFHPYWLSIWGPFGPINNVQALAFVMDYPINHPVIEIRSIRLAQDDPGSEFLEKLPVIDEYGQWIYADWPRKITSLQQLQQDWANEVKASYPTPSITASTAVICRPTPELQDSSASRRSMVSGGSLTPTATYSFPWPYRVWEPGARTREFLAGKTITKRSLRRRSPHRPLPVAALQLQAKRLPPSAIGISSAATDRSGRPWSPIWSYSALKDGV